MRVAELILGSILAGIGLTAMVVLLPFTPIWLGGILLTVGFMAFSFGRSIALRGVLEARTGWRVALERVCLDAGFFAILLTAIVLGPATAAVGLAKGSALATFGGIIVQWLMVFLFVYLGMELFWAGVKIVGEGKTAVEAAIESAQIWRQRPWPAVKGLILVVGAYAIIFTLGGVLAQRAPASIAPWLFTLTATASVLLGEYIYGTLAMRELFKE